MLWHLKGYRYQKPGILDGSREGTVNPDPKRNAMKPFWRVVNTKAWGNLNFSNRPVRTRTPEGTVPKGRPLSRFLSGCSGVPEQVPENKNS